MNYRAEIIKSARLNQTIGVTSENISILCEHIRKLEAIILDAVIDDDE